MAPGDGHNRSKPPSKNQRCAVALDPTKLKQPDPDLADVSAALDNFIGAYLAEFPDLREIHDPQWRSPCEDGQPFRLQTGLEVIRWLPLKRAYKPDTSHPIELCD